MLARARRTASSRVAEDAASLRQLLLMNTTCDCVSTKAIVTMFAVSSPIRPPSHCCAMSVASAAVAQAVRLPSRIGSERNRATITSAKMPTAARLKVRKSRCRLRRMESTTYGTPASSSRKSFACARFRTDCTLSISAAGSLGSTTRIRLEPAVFPGAADGARADSRARPRGRRAPRRDCARRSPRAARAGGRRAAGSGAGNAPESTSPAAMTTSRSWPE